MAEMSIVTWRDWLHRALGPYAWSTNSLPVANGTISPYIFTLVYRYVSAIVPLTSLLVLHAYGPWGRSRPTMLLLEDNIPNKFRIQKERHIRMRKPYKLPVWIKNASGVRTHDLPQSIATTWPMCPHGPGVDVRDRFGSINLSTIHLKTSEIRFFNSECKLSLHLFDV